MAVVVIVTFNDRNRVFAFALTLSTFSFNFLGWILPHDEQFIKLSLQDFMFRRV